jgi:hypothetical protein
MNEFLQSVKADLFERPMLTMLIAVALALVGALVFAVLGGGSSAAPPPLTSTPVHVAGISVTPVSADPAQPVAETTNGTALQRAGKARNPFRPLPVATVAATTGASKKSTSSTTAPTKTSAKSESGKTTPSSGPTTPTTPSKPSAPSKPRPAYNVDLLFGEVPPGTAPLTAHLNPYANVKLLSPIPSAKQPLVIFRGVTAGGKYVAFTLVGELIIHGTASCLPSTTQCELILLKPGQFEQLEYLPPGGQLTTYELRVGSIEKAKASSASLKRARASESKVGRTLLGEKGLKALGGMWYSQNAGVLVFPPRRPSAAQARAASRRLHGKR